MDSVQIQYQDSSGIWNTITIVQNDSQVITMEMRNVQRNYRGARVRAVTMNGRLVDIL